MSPPSPPPPGPPSPSKPIEKKILHAGSKGGKTPQFTNGTKVKFHFVTKKGDEVLDDSRKWDKKDGPMELVYGKKFKLEVWETCLSTMSPGEVSSFKVKRQLTYNYPTVAKSLRDSFDERGKNKSQQHQHMCGMMAMQMQGGLGYDDLNELMKEPADLEFVFEMLSVEAPDEYSKEGWQMDADEKAGAVPALKEEGNALYKEGKTEEAAEKYSKALGMLEQLMLREKPQDEEWLEFQKAKIPLLLNFSQCRLLQGDYYPVIEHCTEVLEADPDNVKALFRRGRAHAGAWNPSEAKADLRRAAELDPGTEAACRKEIRRVEDLEREKDMQDKGKLQGMFSS